jgi:hypothetical protein
MNNRLDAFVFITVSYPEPVWSDWGPWSLCSTTCGPGLQSRDRRCLTSTAALQTTTEEAVKCNGDEFDTEPCELAPCKGNKYMYTESI